MKNLILFSALLFVLSINIFAQGVGINTTSASADASAMLDVSSTTKGFLPPRMTEAQKNAISSPATGLLVYQTDGTSGLYYYNGSAWVNFVTGTHYIGESYAAGIVFWVDATGQHGLIAAPSDQSTMAQWYNGTNRVTKATGDGIGAGEMNTTLIIALQINDNTSGNFAATICSEFQITFGGVYGNWYLPSAYELNLMYIQKTAIGNFSSSIYWSSTEVSDGGAAIQDFGTGTQGSVPKSQTNRVRAIKAF